MKFPNKDVRGALMWAAGIVIVAFCLIVVKGCAVSPDYRPELELGASWEMREPVVGHNPVGIARVRQPVYVWADRCSKAYVEYEHLSSIPDMDDRNTVDQLGAVFKICLGRSQ